MKKIPFFSLFLFLLSFLSLSAETLHLESFRTKNFISDINNAVTSESPETLVKAATPYLMKMKTSNIPNCFGCSLHLIHATENAAPDMQLAAADLAVKFSDDLPEIHHHYLTRIFHCTPFRIDKIIVHFFKAADRSMRFAFADSVIFLFIGKLSTICLIFFIIFIAVMFLKYMGLAVHKYRHLVGFSKFYSIGLIITFFVSVWIVSGDFNNMIYIMIPFLLFFGEIGTRSEKITLHIAAILFMITSAVSMAAEKSRISQYDQEIAFSHLLAVISPDLLQDENIDLSQPGGYMAKGFLFLYNGNFGRAAFNLKKELASVDTREVRTMLSNAIGIALASNGNPQEAVSYLEEAYQQTGDPKIGYNLAKVLYEADSKDESSKLEKSIIYSDSAESFSYPYFYFSDASKIWKYLCYGNRTVNDRGKINSMIYVLFAIFFYFFVAFIRYCYLGSLKLSRCLECGTVMCSKCNAGGNEVCAVCKLMKADSSLFKRGEREIYETRRENFFKRCSIIMNILTFTIPGGGLLFIDRTFEGSLYLAIPLIITLVYFMNSMGLVIDNSDGSIARTVIISINILVYCLSVIRALFAVRRN